MDTTPQANTETSSKASTKDNKEYMLSSELEVVDSAVLANMDGNERARFLGKINKHRGALETTTLETRIKIYAEAYANGANKRDAYAAAGYTCPTFTNGAVFHDKHQKEIDRELRKFIHSKVPTALKVLQEVMVHGKSETARVKAALEILDRAGFDKGVSIQVGHTDPKNESQLKDELRALLLENPDLNFIDGD